IQVSFGVDRKRRRIRKRSIYRGAAIAAPIRGPVSRNCSDSAVDRHLPNAVIQHVRNIQIFRRIKRQGPRAVQLRFPGRPSITRKTRRGRARYDCRQPVWRDLNYLMAARNVQVETRIDHWTAIEIQRLRAWRGNHSPGGIDLANSRRLVPKVDVPRAIYCHARGVTNWRLKGGAAFAELRLAKSGYGGYTSIRPQFPNNPCHSRRIDVPLSVSGQIQGCGDRVWAPRPGHHGNGAVTPQFD